MKDLILLIIFALLIITLDAKTLYWAKKDNYNHHTYFLKNNKLICVAICILAYLIFMKNFSYRKIAEVILCISSFSTQFYIDYKNSQQTKKNGHLVPYAIVIMLIMSSILFS